MNILKASVYLTGILLAVISINVSAANLEQGKLKASACTGCHGANGIGLSAEFPNLAGQKKDYLVKQLNAFKSGSRKDPTMNAMVAALSAPDIENLAAYYSSLEYKFSPVLTLTSSSTDKATEHEFPETVFISMKKSGTVEAFPQRASWKGGPNMLYNAVTPDGKRALVTSPSSNTVYVFDSKNGKQLAVIPVGKAPKGVKVTPDGQFAYVSNQGSADISIISLDKLIVTGTIKVEKGPHNVRFTDDGQRAYVTLQGGAGIGVIDTKSKTLIKVIPVPGITGPHNLDLSADEKTAFVRDFVHHVAVVNLVTEKVSKVITVGNGHGGIDVAPNGMYAVTAAIGDKIVTVIDTETLATQNIEVGNGPHGVRFSQDSQWIYVTVTKDNAVAVINANTMKVEKTIAVGKFPFWVAVLGNP